MENNNNCIGCGKAIPENLLLIRNNLGSTEWVKSGYCSLRCFKDNKHKTESKGNIIPNKCPFCGLDKIENSTICNCGYHFEKDLYKVKRSRETNENILQKTDLKVSGSIKPNKLRNITIWSTVIGFGLGVFLSMTIGFPSGYPGYIIFGVIGYIIGWIIYKVSEWD